MSSRRKFLVSMTATASAAAMWTFRGPESAPVRWCNRPVYPLCEKQLCLTGFQSGLLTCRLLHQGPGASDFQEVYSEQARLGDGVQILSLILPNVHSDYVAGEHVFVATLEQGARQLESPLIRYDLRPFHFGA